MDDLAPLGQGDRLSSLGRELLAFLPGASVTIGENGPRGVVQEVVVRAGPALHYEVAWWVGDERHMTTFPEFEVRGDSPKMRIIL